MSLESRIGVAIVVSIAVLGWLVPAVGLYDPNAFVGTSPPLSPPGPRNFFGTDHLGRDVFTRTFAAAQLDLTLGFFVVVIPLVIGTTAGALAGFGQNPVATAVLNYMSQAINAFPNLVLILAIIAVLGSGPFVLVLATSLVGWAKYYRLSLGRTLIVSRSEYIQATEVLGYSQRRVLLRHVVPNVRPEAIAYGLADFVVAILGIAGLSFLGAGIRPPTPEWGSMIGEARPYLQVAPWIAIFPGMVLALTATGVSMVAQGLDRSRIRG